MTKKGRGAAKAGRPTNVSARILGSDEADTSLFTEDELLAIQREAEEEAHSEHKASARKTLKSKHKSRIKAALSPVQPDDEEEMWDILIDLAPHAADIKLDGVIYMHGSHYRVSRAVYATMRDTMARTWEHEDDVGHANRNHYRKPRETRIGPNDQGRQADSILRV